MRWRCGSPWARPSGGCLRGAHRPHPHRPRTGQEQPRRCRSLRTAPSSRESSSSLELEASSRCKPSSSPELELSPSLLDSLPPSAPAPGDGRQATTAAPLRGGAAPRLFARRHGLSFSFFFSFFFFFFLLLTITILGRLSSSLRYLSYSRLSLGVPGPLLALRLRLRLSASSPSPSSPSSSSSSCF